MNYEMFCFRYISNKNFLTTILWIVTNKSSLMFIWFPQRIQIEM